MAFLVVGDVEGNRTQTQRHERARLKKSGVAPGDCLSLIAADLHDDANWAAAVAGCD